MDTTRSEHDALLASQLAEHLDYLRRFARSRARDEELAEEAVQETLLAALESGQLAAAMLDVTDPEPLPQDHPLWSHPQVLITPHIASVTQPHSAARAVVDNIRRHRAGEEPIGLVDRRLGY